MTRITKFTRNVALTAAFVAGAAAANASIIQPGAMPQAPEVAFQPEVILAQAAPRAGYSGSWYVAPNGCAYSRTQAPGYPARWMLIQNPHHLGLPDAHSGCANSL